MKRYLFLVLLTLIIALAAAWADRIPEPYPGSVLYTPKSSTLYCTKESFEEVVAYFTRTLGNPSSTFSNPDHHGYRTADFIYSRKPGSGTTTITSVTVSESGIIAKNIEPMMEKMYGYMWHHLLEKDRYEEIRKRYAYLNGFLFPDPGDGSALEKIYKKYEIYSTTGFWDPAERQALTDELDRIAKLPRTRDQAVREQRRAERRSVDAKLDEAWQRALKVISTSEGVDFWLKYLDEIAEEAEKNPYRVKIEMKTITIEVTGDKG